MLMTAWRTAVATAAIVLFAAGPAAAGEVESTGLVAPHFGNWGFDLTGRDLAVKPGADFNLYANGNWLKRTEIPADKSEYGNFSKLYDLSEAIVHKLIEDAAAGRSNDPDAAKIGAAYRSYMDEARVERLDAKPLDNDLAAIRAEKTKADIIAAMGKPGFGGAIFDAGIIPDPKAPDRYTVALENGGLGLPDRDYYLNAELADKKIKYQTYVALMLGMIGWPEPAINAKAVLEFETKLAEASWTRTEQRDIDKIYNPMTVAQLAAYAPGFDFRAFLDRSGLASVDRVIVGPKTAFPKVAKIFDATALDTLKAWQAFHLASSAAGYLSKRFGDARFNFYGKELSGQPEQEPRWKRAVAFVGSALGDSIGRMYVATYFPRESKAKVEILVKELIEALHNRIARLDWMSPATKAKAQEKLSKLTVKIGYPAKWRDYGPLTMTADDLYGNVVRNRVYGWNYRVQRLHQPVDKEDWEGEFPQTVNAGYNPLHNEIVFPAAILQPPFFDPTADMAVNYGGIGAVIGHELTHGFDDQGRKFDGNGMLTDWWTAEDTAKFTSEAERLAAQFDKFEPVKGHFVNGRLTMGENIADLGGLLLALDAYHAALHGKEPPNLEGLTGDQRVFLGWGQNWRDKMRDDAAIQAVKIDPHSPAQFRVNGPVRNIAAWYDAFKIGAGDPMYIAPEKRVKIW